MEILSAGEISRVNGIELLKLGAVRVFLCNIKGTSLNLRERQYDVLRGIYGHVELESGWIVRKAWSRQLLPSSVLDYFTLKCFDSWCESV